MKAKIKFKWGKYYDWVIIPSILIGARDPYDVTVPCKRAVGIGVVFLKFKVSIILFIL
jgi:hypothetical protein